MRGGSFRRVLRTRALRRAELPRTAAPVTGRLWSPPYPAAAPASTTTEAVILTPNAPIAGRLSQLPGRSAAHYPDWPLQRQGHLKIVSNRFAETIFRTHP